MAGLKETEIGLLPQEWELTDIGSCFDVRQGKQLSARHRCGTNEKCFLRTSNVYWGKLDLTDLDKMHFSSEEAEELTLRNGDLLVCEGGDIGRTAIWQGALKDCYYQNHLHRLRAKDKSTDSEFCMYWLMYGFLIGKVYFGVGNKTTIPNLSQSRLKSLLIPLPSVTEQQSIAHILSQVQSAIQTQEKIIQTTTELKKALMQKFFTEGLRGEPQKETEVGLIPKSWEVKAFEDIITLQRGKDLSKDKFVQGEFPVGGSNGIIGYHNQFNAKAPGITVGRSGSCGKVIFYDRDFWAHNTALVVRDFHGNNDKFVYYFLCFLKLERYKSGVSVPTLNRNAFRAVKMVIPHIEEQVEIAKTLEQADKKISTAIEKRNILQVLFKSMLYHLMTGQVRVNNLKLG